MDELVETEDKESSVLRPPERRGGGGGGTLVEEFEGDRDNEEWSISPSNEANEDRCG